MKKYYILWLVFSALLLGVSCDKAEATEDLILGVWDITEVRKSKGFGMESFQTILTDFDLEFNSNGTCRLVINDSANYNTGVWSIEMETYYTGIMDDDGYQQTSVREKLNVEWQQTMQVLNECYFSRTNSNELNMHGQTNAGYLYYYCKR